MESLGFFNSYSSLDLFLVFTNQRFSYLAIQFVTSEELSIASDSPMPCWWNHYTTSMDDVSLRQLMFVILPQYPQHPFPYIHPFLVPQTTNPPPHRTKSPLFQPPSHISIIVIVNVIHCAVVCCCVAIAIAIAIAFSIFSTLLIIPIALVSPRFAMTFKPENVKWAQGLGLGFGLDLGMSIGLFCPRHRSLQLFHPSIEIVFAFALMARLLR